MSPPRKRESRLSTLLFVTILCFVCGFVLAFLATSLKEPQERAAQLNKIKELLAAAKILGPDGHFLDAKEESRRATDKEIFAFYAKRVEARFTDAAGNSYSAAELNIDLDDYMAKHRKKGYALLKYKLFYRISTPDGKGLYALVIPVSGFGLWDAIYGYIAIASDGVHVLGTTWYEQKETPGLGAEIASSEWQKQFFNKSIFQMDGGSLNMAKDAMGIIVVKGKVSQVMGKNPLSASAVDGLPGASLTGEGVTQAYRDSLTPYRALFEHTAKERP